jgi:hypothetical protein
LKRRSFVKSGARFLGEDFSDLDLVQFDVEDCEFRACRFERTRITSASFASGVAESLYMDCSFDSSRITTGPIGPARFERCSFRNTVLRDWFAMDAEFVDCLFSGEMRRGWFNGAVGDEAMRSALGRDRNEVRGNDFTDMELIDVSFRTGVDLKLQRIPVGPQYVFLPDAKASLQEATRIASGLPDETRRAAVLSSLGSLSYGLEGGQEQLLLRDATGSGKDARAWNDALGFLRLALQSGD